MHRKTIYLQLKVQLNEATQDCFLCFPFDGNADSHNFNLRGFGGLLKCPWGFCLLLFLGVFCCFCLLFFFLLCGFLIFNLWPLILIFLGFELWFFINFCCLFLIGGSEPGVGANQHELGFTIDVLPFLVGTGNIQAHHTCPGMLHLRMHPTSG